MSDVLENYCREAVRRKFYGSLADCLDDVEDYVDTYSDTYSIGKAFFDKGRWIEGIYFFKSMLEYLTGKEVVINERLLESLKRKVSEGKVPYCPCSLLKRNITVCPCIFAVREVLDYGRCSCGLYRIKD